MKTKQIPARDVRKRDQLTAVPGERLRPRRSGWPTVTDVEYLENGEGGQPTVYIETHEMPGYTWPFRPDEPVRVLTETPSIPVPWRHVLRPGWPAVVRGMGRAVFAALILYGLYQAYRWSAAVTDR